MMIAYHMPERDLYTDGSGLLQKFPAPLSFRCVVWYTNTCQRLLWRCNSMKKISNLLALLLLLAGCQIAASLNGNPGNDLGPTGGTVSSADSSQPPTEGDRFSYLEAWCPDTSGEGSNFEDRSKIGSTKIVTREELGGEFIQEESRTLTYYRTVNWSDNDLPVNKRFDTYGTMDRYVDEEGIEYSYLYNTDLLLAVYRYVLWSELPQESAIPEAEALKIASEFLSKIRKDAAEYQLLSIFYEQAGRYIVHYRKHVSGFGTDAVMWVQVEADGKITSFAENSYKRYDNITLSDREVQRAETAATASLERTAKAITQEIGGSKVTYETRDSYISIDDDGCIVLVVEYRYKGESLGGSMFTRHYEQIKKA
jgi:uncharacterized OB-fold protein